MSFPFSLSASSALNLREPSFWIAAVSVAFNPTFWNIIARWEHRSRSLTRFAGGQYRGCYFLAFTIFSLGLVRDYLYAVALDHQPVFALLQSIYVKWIAALLLIIGNILVFSSMWRLGITGTYLGDYFGILMTERVTSFPFSVMDNPMYNGSTICFVGAALWKASGAGLVLSIWIWVVYCLALAYEGPFTAHIYSQHNQNRAKNNRSSSKRD